MPWNMTTIPGLSKPCCANYADHSVNGLYIHIPFCRKRCIYCDFYSTTSGTETKNRYIGCLCNEIRLRADYLPSKQLQTIYIGGGTPSQLQPQQLEDIFNTVGRTFHVATDAEITLEANPDDLTPEYIKALRSCTPVNRVSMGVQSFDDAMLMFLNRRHTAAQARKAISSLALHGIGNISIDLIYGLPGQTLQQWRNDLATALSISTIKHLSAYALTYEEGTRLWQMREQGRAKEADDGLSLDMYRLLLERTEEAGFDHYEISNFARPGFQARHNGMYWKDVPYLGVGPAAHSYDGSSRQWNLPDIKAYLGCRGDTVGGQLYEKEVLTTEMKYNETLLKRLRTSEGLALDFIEQTFGTDRKQALLDTAARFQEKGLLRIDRHKGTVCLTKDGIFVSDGIIRELFLDGTE